MNITSWSMHFEPGSLACCVKPVMPAFDRDDDHRGSLTCDVPILESILKIPLLYTCP